MLQRRRWKLVAVLSCICVSVAYMCIVIYVVCRLGPETKTKNRIVHILRGNFITRQQVLTSEKQKRPSNDNMRRHDVRIRNVAVKREEQKIASHTQRVTSPTHNVTTVFLGAYFRTGSSLLGEILQQDDRVFYIYEPLISLYVAIDSPTKQQTLINGTKISVTGNFESRTTSILEAYYTCKFDMLDVGTITHGFQKFGRKSSLFLTCVKQANRSSSIINAIKLCLPILEQQCRRSEYRILKVLRLPFQILHGLLSRIPNLKIVHLVRDPRAIFFSLDKLGANIVRSLESEALIKYMCSLLLSKAETVDSINMTHPATVTRILYEDLAREPIKTSRYIYIQLKLNFTEKIRDYIHHITMSGHDDHCANCFIRPNSSRHIDGWRGEWNQANLSVVERICKPYLTKFRYELLT